MLATKRKNRTKRSTQLKKSLAPKKWALLAYIAGDNNLSDAGLQDISEMCDVGASTKVHAAVQIDTFGPHDGSIRYEISEPDETGAAHRAVIERLPEDDSGDPRILKAFLTWGLTRYPADNTLVVVWNHGAGFRTPRRDIAYDDFGSSLDMPEIEWAMKNAGISRKNRLAILGFDACLMNMVEIVHHLRDLVRFVVGSQQTEPGDGWPYDKVLDRMKISAGAQDLAEAIVDEYILSYKAIGMQDVTQSAVDADKTPDAILALDRLGQALADGIDKYRPGMQTVRARVQAYSGCPDYVDMVNFGELVATDIPDNKIVALAQSLIAKTKAAVVHNGWFGQSVRNSNGLSMWFPEARSLYINNRNKYEALNFAQLHKGWINFLDVFHAS